MLESEHDKSVQDMPPQVKSFPVLPVYEFAGEVWDAAAPAVLVGEVVHHLGHGHAGADDVGLDLVAIGFGFSHIQMFLLFFRYALW